MHIHGYYFHLISNCAVYDPSLCKKCDYYSCGLKIFCRNIHFRATISRTRHLCNVGLCSFIYYVDFYPLGHNVMQSTESEPTFWRNMLLASSGLKSRPSKWAVFTFIGLRNELAGSVSPPPPKASCAFCSLCNPIIFMNHGDFSFLQLFGK
jgi:hypothetical protein